jgi:hypothetical protein
MNKTRHDSYKQYKCYDKKMKRKWKITTAVLNDFRGITWTKIADKGCKYNCAVFERFPKVKLFTSW